MEGVGSRLGRAPSRAVFSGPVRKWKKQWVRVSCSSLSSSVSYQKNNHNSSRPNNGGNGNNKASALILRRWTPVSPNPENPEEPPRRKFRYTPIVVLEQEKEAFKKADDKSKTSKARPLARGTISKVVYEKSNQGDDFMEEIQAANKSPLA